MSLRQRQEIQEMSWRRDLSLVGKWKREAGVRNDFRFFIFQIKIWLFFENRKRRNI